MMKVKILILLIIVGILITLTFIWLQGYSGCLGTLCIKFDDLTQIGQSKVQEDYSGIYNFRIWPDKYTIQKGYGLKMIAGINNDADDGQNHTFVINVVPAQASIGPCPSGNISSCTASGGESLNEFMQNWVSWENQPGLIPINRVGFRTITVNVPINAVSGTYIFEVVACKDVSPYSMCTPQTFNFGGSPQQLTIIV